MCAQVANGIIRSSMLNAEVHPKLDAQGKFPRNFQGPLKVRDFLAMESLFPYFLIHGTSLSLTIPETLSFIFTYIYQNSYHHNPMPTPQETN